MVNTLTTTLVALCLTGLIAATNATNARSAVKEKKYNETCVQDEECARTLYCIRRGNMTSAKCGCLSSTYKYDKETLECGSPFCNSGFLTLGSVKCYKYMATNKTWQDALDSCKKIGATLAEPLNLREIQGMRGLTMASAESESFEDGAWLGASYAAKENRWIWESSGNRVDHTYQDWVHGRPSNNNDDDDCLAMMGDNRKWHDVSCSTKRPYI